jgi:hypothetical protein
VLGGPQYSNVCTVTDKEYNGTSKIAQTYVINEKLGPAFAEQET